VPAIASDDLEIDGFGIQAYRSPEVDIEILEWQGEQGLALQVHEGFQVGPGASRADAIEQRQPVQRPIPTTPSVAGVMPAILIMAQR
jgi:hypothetical protein